MLFGNRLSDQSIISCAVFSKNVIFLTNSSLSNLIPVLRISLDRFLAIGLVTLRIIIIVNQLLMNPKNRAVFSHMLSTCQCLGQSHICVLLRLTDQLQQSSVLRFIYPKLDGLRTLWKSLCRIFWSIAKIVQRWLMFFLWFYWQFLLLLVGMAVEGWSWWNCYTYFLLHAFGHTKQKYHNSYSFSHK